MGLLLFSLLFTGFALCAASTVDATSVNWSRNWPWYQKNQPRRPPPPFDIPRPYHRPPFGIRINVTTSIPEISASTTPPIVLYKRECDPCWPGWGVKSLCNHTSNTVCTPCPLGSWSPRTHHYRPCVPCSKCGPGLYEDLNCLSSRDTKCDSCSNVKAKINDDFMKKCDWRQLMALNPRDMDLDDTRFDVEVMDLKSKELDSPEFGSNEDDLDRIFLSQVGRPEHEEDITVDDPEIDIDQPEEKKDVQEKDASKEEEDEWARVMASRREAQEEIAQISRRQENQGKAAQRKEEDESDDNDDDEEDIAQGPRRLLLHPIRPLPQMMPAPERTIHVEPEDDIVRSMDPQVENNFPPSFHQYPIDSLLHAGEGQRRKAIVLLVLTCAIILSTIAFAVCYVKAYCRRRATYNRVLVVNLTPEEREIVRQSAQALETMDKPVKKFRGSDHSYTRIMDTDSESGVYVTENPLEAYLNSTDDRYVAKETLLENEVLDDDPKVHRHMTSQ